MAKATVIGTTERRVEPKIVKQYGIQGFDIDNLYPQRIDASLSASVTGDACANLFATHLNGRGFALSELNEYMVNSDGQTLREVHELICNDYARFRGACYHIAYNGLLEAVELRHVPFAWVRLAEEDDLGNVDHVVVYEDWDGSKYRRVKTEKMKHIDMFTADKEKIAKQIDKAGGFDKWNGHIYYHSFAAKLTYPKSKADPCFEDVLTEAGIKKFYQRMVQTGFMAGSAFVHKGKFENDEAREEFQNNLKQYQGADRSHTMILVEAETEDQVPVIKEFPIIDNDKLFENTEPTVRDRIIRCFEQPIVLHAIKTPGSLGDSTEWLDATKNYDGKTEKERDRLSLLYSRIFVNWHEVVNPSQEWTIIPVSGIEEKAKRSVLATKIGVGGMQSLQAIVQDQVMTAPQKINFLIIAFGVSQSDADAIVNGTPIQE